MATSSPCQLFGFLVLVDAQEVVEILVVITFVFVFCLGLLFTLGGFFFFLGSLLLGGRCFLLFFLRLRFLLLLLLALAGARSGLG